MTFRFSFVHLTLLLQGILLSSACAQEHRSTPKLSLSAHEVTADGIKSLENDPTPYLLPDSSPLKPVLDKIFSKRNVVLNEKNFKKAGFKIVYTRPKNSLRVAKHPKIPGYFFKVNLETETNHKGDISQQDWLIRRCIGARKIKKIIKEKNLNCFCVADKWLYEVPTTSLTNPERRFVLIATDMQIVSGSKSSKAWKTKATKKCLRQLLTIVRHGCASSALTANIPYSKVHGKFAFIDTEYPDRIFELDKIKRHFSPKKQKYWDSITH